MRLLDVTSSQNVKELQLGDGTRILFSHGIPVAAYIPAQNGYVRTNQRYSVTSTRHVNEWIGRDVRKTPQVEQSVLDRLGEP